MKKLSILFICILVMATGVAAQELTATKLTDDVLVVSGAGGNITAFRTNEGILITDTFVNIKSARTARNLIEEAFPGSRIQYVINTHHHFDHVAGNQVFADARIISQVNASERVRQEYAERAATYASAKEKIIELTAKQEKVTDEKARAELQKELQQWQQTYEAYGDYKLVPAPVGIETGGTIWLGDDTFLINYVGPGHTDGDITILNPEQRVLVTGDLLFNDIVPYIIYRHGACVEGWIKNLDYLISRSEEYDHVVSGHGAVGTVEDLKQQRQYLVDLWQAVNAAHNDGKTLEQAKSEIKLEKYKDYMRYDALNTNIEACWQMLEK